LPAAVVPGLQAPPAPEPPATLASPTTPIAPTAPTAAASAPAASAAAVPHAAQPLVVGRLPRGNLWGRHGKFVLARTHRSGTLEAITVTCLVHSQGERCNKSLTLGPDLTEQDAVARIKEWCIRGLQIPDSVGARTTHMAIHPRRFKDSEVRSEQALDLLVDA
jgi:hypothetical protein